MIATGVWRSRVSSCFCLEFYIGKKFLVLTVAKSVGWFTGRFLTSGLLMVVKACLDTPHILLQGMNLFDLTHGELIEQLLSP